MEMQTIQGGRLRAAGYDRRTRVLRIEFTDGTTLDHLAVGEEVWRRLASSASAWSYYRDNIEETYTTRRADGRPPDAGRSNPLDALFGDD